MGKLLRIWRNCTTDDDYRREANDLYQRFRERDYSHCSLRRARKMAMMRTRCDILKLNTVRENNYDGPVRIITPYGAQWVLQEYWHILTRRDNIRSIVGPRLLMVAKRVRNLNDMLVQ